MNIRDLSVEPRETVGKGAVGRLRRQGLVPAILYGGGHDPVTLAAVNDVETLTTGLSSKIWQKITLLDQTRRSQD